MLLCSVTFQAFTDALRTVFPWCSMAGIASPCLSASSALSLCMGIGLCGSCLLLVSLPISFPIHIYVTIYPACMCSALTPHDSWTHMFSAFDACSFCSALYFHYVYIRLKKHVCFASSYINFDIHCHSHARV